MAANNITRRGALRALVAGSVAITTPAAAIGADPGLVASSLGVKSVASLATGQGPPVRFKVVAQLPSAGGSSPGLLPGLVGSEKALASLAGSPPGAILLVKAASGVPPSALGRDQAGYDRSEVWSVTGPPEIPPARL